MKRRSAIALRFFVDEPQPGPANQRPAPRWRGRSYYLPFFFGLFLGFGAAALLAFGLAFFGIALLSGRRDSCRPAEG
jgi:hypothetical protein